MKIQNMEIRLGLFAIVAFGSIVHATTQLKIARDKKAEFSRIDFAILVPIAAFAGLIFGLIAYTMNSNIVRVVLSSGIWSFLGIAGLNNIASVFLSVLTNWLQSRTNLPTPPKNEDNK